MRVTSVQLEIKDQEKEKTLEYVLKILSQIPTSDLILLPELWPCGYLSFDRYRDESEPIDGPTVKALKRKAIELESHIFMGSIVEKDRHNLFNTTLLLNPQGQIIARYRKIHLFGYQSQESEILSRGEDLVVVDTPWGIAGISTCYDLRFPELYRRMVDQGAQFFLVAAAWPYPRLEAWILLNRVRALENVAYLFSCNCGGLNRGRQYVGHSMFIDPWGTIIAGGGDGECIVSAEVDVGSVDSVRNDFRVLDDRVLD